MVRSCYFPRCSRPAEMIDGSCKVHYRMQDFATLLRIGWDLRQLRGEVAAERSQSEPFADQLAACGCWL